MQPKTLYLILVGFCLLSCSSAEPDHAASSEPAAVAQFADLQQGPTVFGNSNWTLTSMRYKDTSYPRSSGIKVRFSGPNISGGNCQRFYGPISVSEDAGTIEMRQIQITEDKGPKNCSPEVYTQESHLVEVLQFATAYELSGGNSVTFRGSKGSATFIKQQ